MAANQTKQEIKITGYTTTRFNKVEKKYMRTLKIPTGDTYFVQCTVWVPNTPAYSKAPKICLTFNNYRDRLQILFPTALDLFEFTRVLFEWQSEQLKELNAAHTEAMKEYTELHELILKHSDEKARERAQKEFEEKNPDTNAHENI